MVTPSRSSSAGTPTGTPAGDPAGAATGSGRGATGGSTRSGTRTRGGGTPRPRGAAAARQAPADAPVTAAATAREPETGPRLADRLADRLHALPALAARARERARERLTAHRTPAASTATATTRERSRALDEEGTDWARVGIFAAGIAIGALIGAGSALLLAPATGFETRVRLARTARRATGSVADRVGDLGEAVRRGAHRGRQRVTRGVVRGRWAAEDAWERRMALARGKVARGEV